MATLVQSTTTNSFQPQPTIPSSASQSLNNMTFNTQPHNNFQRNMSFPQAQSGGNAINGYRGIATAPVAPYAFKSTPNLTTNDPKFQPNKQEVRASAGFDNQPRQRQPTPHTNTAIQQIPSTLNHPHQQTQSGVRPNPTVHGGGGGPSHTLTALPAASRPPADRYRRNVKRSESFGHGGGGGSVGGVGDSLPHAPVDALSNMSIYSNPGKASSSPALPLSVSNSTSAFGSRTYAEAVAVGVKPVYATGDRAFSKDDTLALKQTNARSKLQQKELMDRRRSIGAFDLNTQVGNSAGGLHNGNPFMFNQPNFFQPTPPRSPATENSSPATLTSPGNPFHRRESSDSISSKNSSNGSQTHKVKQQQQQVTNSTATVKQNSSIDSVSSSRGASDAKKRSTNPSPLSKPMTMSPDPNKPEEAKEPEPEPEITPVRPRTGGSVAADRLAALQAESRKGFKSRLRRAFSFGSAAELKQAAALSAEDRQRLRQEREDAEQMKIAERQEAGGLGNSIYSNNQGGIFSGSTDNLSISSTASSASVMLRKMGKGMKRGSRSFVGLFRPKSVIGVEAASGPIATPVAIEPATAQVSMVTVEAERERVNINASPLEHTGGGTGFPKLERNSLDAGRQEPGPSTDATSRRSIVGGERERAEVLAAVKKGILKQPGSSSPVVKPTTELPADLQLPQIPIISSQPTTPDVPDNKETNEDYFLAPNTAPKYTVPKSPSSSAISAPVTNQEITKARASVSFSQKLTFYETWTSGEYDRRGEISTCNKLTPALAQQIKEELNTFKMEMEVHESSRVYTHFF
ncbi:hypothetical protein TWF106_001178 [Orbilia oligospora]|uniref:Bud neck involved protein n=1 Tax=Orbilia oligospora TaxID=2813651 RepID=A0A7C8QC53_ORBOL|nr:hypothetical protein TWF679_003532 [Orbilia oligospora]KAF3205255.1 hypothetical protein TWF106_001178 [Orbilia oligospora]